MVRGRRGEKGRQRRGTHYYSAASGTLRKVRTLPSMPGLVCYSLGIPVSKYKACRGQRMRGEKLRVRSPRIQALPVTGVRGSIIPCSFLPMLGLMDRWRVWKGGREGTAVGEFFTEGKCSFCHERSFA